MKDDIVKYEGILVQRLKARGLTISTAESCTGGMIAHILTLRSGSSAYFKGSVVSYCNEIKERVLGVSRQTIERHTEVSGEVALEMSAGVVHVMGTDVGISTTGIAGPTGAMPGKPVGTVWISARCGGQEAVELYTFAGDRAEVIEQASLAAIKMAIRLVG